MTTQIKHDGLPLIPTNRVAVTETFYPKGWQAARYDAEGFREQSRWFPTRAEADAHAKGLGQ